ncbi:MAG: hypothetical protein NVSMB62_18020 [Acidobacteriaceae bacterium]
MKIYFDTNVLIAAVQPDHVHHPASFAALGRVRRRLDAGYISTQGLSEIYSVLTRTPFAQRVHPEQAALLIGKTIAPLLHIVEVTEKSYLTAIAVCASAGWKGGRVHDAVHVQAAAQVGCKVIYTYNLGDLKSVAGEFRGRIEDPPAP